MSAQDRAIQKLAKELAGIKREVVSWRGPQADYTSIENSGNFTFKDSDGNVTAVAGGQDDGGTTINVIAGPTPPTPVNYTVTVDHGSLTVHWDGEFEDDAVAPTDWARWTAYAQPGEFVVPERSTAIGGTDSASGGEVTAGVLKGQWTVTVLAWSQAGKPSAMGLPVTVDVPGYGDIVLAEIDAAETLIKNAGEILVTEQGTLGEKLAESDAALDALEVSLGELDETTLPALRNDLDAAEGRLDSAEGQITDAFGELALVPGQITDATQDALILAATDAQARADAAQAAADEAARAYAEAIATGIEPVDLDALRDHMNTKAAQAKQAAIDAAALDATAKANAAKSQAQAWDEALSASINDTIDGAVDDLSADIEAVQVSADGKNTIKWDPAAPTSATPGKAVNDIWYRTSGNSIIGYWKWSGSAWVQQTLSATVIPQIDIGAGTFGEMDGARLKAGSIYADRIVSGLSQNMVPDPGFVSPEINASRLLNNSSFGGTWDIAGGVLSCDTNGGTMTNNSNFPLAATSDREAWSAYPGMTMVHRFSARVVGGTATVRGTAYTLRRDGTKAYSALTPAAFQPITSEWKEYSFSTALGDDITSYSTALQVGRTSTGVVEFKAPFSASMVGTTVIEQGAVTTDRLAANVLEVGNLKAGTAAIAEAVVQKIAAQTASIQRADIKNLFVTGTASLSDVVAERIAAETAEFIELEVGNLVAGTGTMDEATINKLFADVVVAGMSIATEFIGENAILTGAVTAPKITASEELWAKIGEFVKIRAEQLEADAIDGMVITGPTIQSARTGQRWVGDATGIRIFNADNEVRTQLSPDDSVFKGEVEADTLVVNGGSELRSTENKLAQGAKLTLEAGVTDPTAPPTVQPYWDATEFTSGTVNGEPMKSVGLAWDGTNYWTAHSRAGAGGASSRMIVFRIDVSTGSGSFVFISIPNGTPNHSELFGVTCIGSELFWLGRSFYEGMVWITDLAGAFKRAFAYPDLGYTRTNPLGYKPGIGNDGTNVVVAQCDDAGPLNVRTYNKTTGALISSAKDASDGTKSDITGVYVGTADWGGSTKYAAVRKASRSQVVCFNATTGVYDASKLFETATADSTGVVFHDGQFHTLDPTGKIHEYADTNTGDASGDWWATYRWSADVDEDGINDSVSRIGPVKRFTWPRRGKLKFLGAPLPVGAGYITPSIAKKATTPVRNDFRTPGFSVNVGESVAFLSVLPTDWLSGGNPGDANTFPEAESSVLQSASGTFRVQGDGSGHWGPLKMARNGVMSGLVVSGMTTVAVTTGGSRRAFTISLPSGRFTKPPRVWVQPSTSGPDIVAASVRADLTTPSTFTMYFYRTDTVNTDVVWFAMDAE